MLGLLLLFLLAWLIGVIARPQLVRVVHKLASRTRSTWDDMIVSHGVIRSATRVLPAMAIYLGVPLVPDLSDGTVILLQRIALVVIVLVLVSAVNAALSAGNAIYEMRPDARRKPIKGYVQVVKIVVICLGLILAIAIVLDKSPVILLSGFGAATAILLLVFRDTILSLVASIQLSSLDMVRVGDWIEMPDFNADGDVIDVSLHTIRVQNWDKTITTIPTHRLISDSFRNWRGMSESGGVSSGHCSSTWRRSGS